MTWVSYAVANAPEIFIFLAVAIGTLLGQVRIRGFALGATACTLIVAVILGQLGTFVIPPLLRSIFFGLFVFTIGYRSGPEFFASLSLQTLSQVALALVIGVSGLAVVLAFAFLLHLDAGTAAGLASGSLTQSSMMGTASGALNQLGLPEAVLKQLQGNIAAGYAVTYVCGYILVLLFVPLVAPWLMGVKLKEEATKLEAALSGGTTGKAGNLLYRRLQARAYRVSVAAGRTVGELEAQIGRRVVVERILRDGADVEPSAKQALRDGDEILLAGPSSAIVTAASAVGEEIEGEHVMRAVPASAICPAWNGSAKPFSNDQRVESVRSTRGNRLFYLATPPGVFGPIGCHLGRSGLTREKNGAWRRLIVEKPFGTDLRSASALNHDLLQVLDEHQIYRIDRYLGKETVQNILVLRFANGLFEPIWNRRHIDHVQITVAETLTVARRGRSYDTMGPCATWFRTIFSSCCRSSPWSHRPVSKPNGEPCSRSLMPGGTPARAAWLTIRPAVPVRRKPRSSFSFANLLTRLGAGGRCSVWNAHWETLRLL
jgi:AspT/YidE/YbjL antiporter-like protein